MTAVDADLAKWEREILASGKLSQSPSGLVHSFPLDEGKGKQITDAVDPSRGGTVEGNTKWEAGKIGGALEFDGQTFVPLGEIGSMVLSLLSGSVAKGQANPVVIPEKGPQPGASLQVGVAEVDITPPIGFPMAGYYHERLAEGSSDSLKAKAIVLRDARAEAAIVVCDLIGIATDLSQAVRKRASEKTGIPATNIVVSATHSHTAPDYMSSNFAKRSRH